MLLTRFHHTFFSASWPETLLFWRLFFGETVVTPAFVSPLLHLCFFLCHKRFSFRVLFLFEKGSAHLCSVLTQPPLDSPPLTYRTFSHIEPFRPRSISLRNVHPLSGNAPPPSGVALRHFSHRALSSIINSILAVSGQQMD